MEEGDGGEEEDIYRVQLQCGQKKKAGGSVNDTHGGLCGIVRLRQLGLQDKAETEESQPGPEKRTIFFSKKQNKKNDIFNELSDEVLDALIAL